MEVRKDVTIYDEDGSILEGEKKQDPLVPYPHTYIALYHSHAKLPVTHTHTQKQEIVNHPS